MSTSPVPAVASDGGPASQTTTAPLGEATIVSAPLRSTVAPKRFAAVLGRLEAVRVDPGGVGVEQARQLAGMRSENRRSIALDRLEAEERVGVDDGREIDTRQQLANEGASGIRAPEAGPDRERRRPLARPPSARPTRIVVRPWQLHGLQSQDLCGRERLLGNRQRDVARVGAKRGHRREARRACHSRSTSDDEDGAG